MADHPREGATPPARDDGTGATLLAETGAASTLLGGAARARECDEGPRLSRGAVLGRYFIIEPLGAGGMGVVYTAYDPELDRKVAIKLMHRLGGSDDASARLQREAKLTAKIAHPNVITVHDVGTIDGRVFVAMELVEGPTLRKWLATPRRWREALAAVLAAGRGLAAAHDAGLVHRDFKPENVLIGADGRVRVLDFGLARPTDAGENNEHGPKDMPDGPVRTTLTPRGAIAGTPAYMSPEQYEGRDLDARSDQFSLCVTLWEALYGEHPFAAGNVYAMAHAIGSGQVRPPRRDAGVPKRIARVLLRGLAVRPEDRHPSVHALLAELERDPWRWARRALPWASAAVAAAAAAVGASLYFEPGEVEVRALRAGQPVTPVRVQVGEVELAVGPDGARGELPAGTYRVVVTAAGHHPDESVVEVQRGGLHQITRELRREQGRFTLDVEPAGGTVLVDGVDHGSRLRGLPVDTGPHALVVRKEGHHDATLAWTAGRDVETAGFVSLAPALRWSRRAANGLYEPQALDDVDGDGAAELLFRYFNILRAVDPWTDRTLWTLDLDRRSAAAVAVVDVDGDGTRELFARWAAEDGLHVGLWSTGPSPARDDQPPPRRWTRTSRPAGRGDGEALVQVLARDLDGDGFVDLAVLGGDDAGVTAYSGRDGRTLWTAQLREPVLGIALLSEGPAAIAGVTAARRFALAGRRGAVLWDMPAPAGRRYASGVTVVPGEDGDDVLLTAYAEDAVQCRHDGADGGERWCVRGRGDRAGGDVRARPSVELAGPGRARPLMLVRVGDAFAVFDATGGTPLWQRAFDEAYPLVVGEPLLYAARVGAELVVGAAEDGREVFRAPVAGRPSSALVRHDWDADGRDELVFGVGSHDLVALDAASGARVGSAQVAGPAMALRAAGDVDRDGFPDLFVRTPGGPAVVGGPRVLWSRRAEDAIRATPTLADLDGDGDLELAVFGSFDAKKGLHVFDAATGARVAGPPTESRAPDVIRGVALLPGAAGGHDLAVQVGSHGELQRYRGRDAALVAQVTDARMVGYAAPTVIEVAGAPLLATSPWADGDAVLFDPQTLAVRRRIALPAGSWNAPVPLDMKTGPALVFGLHDGTIRAFGAEDGRERWRFTIGGLPIGAPTIGSFAGATVVLASRLGRARDLIALDPETGTEVWSEAGLGALRTRPLLADVDGDGATELVMATDRRGLVALDGWQAIRWQYAPRRAAEQPEANVSPRAVDLDGDGRPEVLATFRDGALHVVDGATGALRWRFPLREQTIEAEPVTGDVDGDGVQEIVLAGHDQQIHVLRSPR